MYTLSHSNINKGYNTNRETPTKSTYPTLLYTIHTPSTPWVQSKVYSISGIFEIRWEIIKDESDVHTGDNLQILISSGLDHVKSCQAVTAGDTRA